LGKFLIAVLATPPVRGVVIPLASILRQKAFHFYGTVPAALYRDRRRQDQMTRD